MSVPIIAVTGTKGKTTTVAVIADVMQRLRHNVLKVDTTGHFVNGERRSTLEDSKETWRLVPSVCPGRFMYEFQINPELRENAVAVLECSLGCSAPSGMGFRYQKVGVFLNVYEDHIGSSARIQNKEDIAIAKSFIFSRLVRNDPCAVFNADDKLVVWTLRNYMAKERVNPRFLPCGFEFSHYDLAAHLAEGGSAVTVDADKQVVLRDAQGDTVLFDTKQIPWTFQGTFVPSLWNLMQAAAAVIGFYDGQIPAGFREAFEANRLDSDGGRLTVLRNSAGVTILADYAHEKVSLKLVGHLARTMLGPEGRVIGVVRLAHDRTDELMRETGQDIAPAYDSFIVYDKIDGELREVKRVTGTFPEVAGRTSEIFAEGIRSVNPNVERIVREDEAIARAAEVAKPGDVVVAIVNDDIKRSIGFIKQSFGAELV